MLDRQALKAVAAAIGRGDGAAFRSLYDDRAATVYGTALRITGNPDHATEAMEHTFVEAWRSLTSGQGKWPAPDLGLLRIARRHAVEIVRRHNRRQHSATEMTDPVKDGTASFELLKLLQTLSHLSEKSREMLTAVWFDALTSDEAASRFSLTEDETTRAVRKLYAEFREADPANDPVLDREADIVAMCQALGFAKPVPDSDQSAIEAWEHSFAPFGELVTPIAPPSDAFAAIMTRVNATQSAAHIEKTSRKSEVWRAAMYVVVAMIAAILIYVALVAIGDDATAKNLKKLTGETDDRPIHLDYAKWP